MAQPQKKSGHSSKPAGNATRTHSHRDAQPSLTDVVKAAAGRPTSRNRPQPRSSSAISSLSESIKAVASKTRNPPRTRQGRSGILIYVDEPVREAFRRLADEYDATNQVLGEWALKLLFEKLDEAWPE